MKIKFTRNTTKQEGGEHTAGDIVELNEASAMRWIRMGIVEIIPNMPNKAIKSTSVRKKGGK